MLPECQIRGEEQPGPQQILQPWRKTVPLGAPAILRRGTAGKDGAATALLILFQKPPPLHMAMTPAYLLPRSYTFEDTGVRLQGNQE